MCVDTNIDADRLHIKSLAAQTHLVRLYHSCAFLLAIFDDAFVSHLSRVWACAADFARRNLLRRLGGGLVCRDSIRGIHHGGVATEAVLVGGHVFRLVLLEVGRVWWRRALGSWHFGSVQESTSRTWTLPARRLHTPLALAKHTKLNKALRMLLKRGIIYVERAAQASPPPRLPVFPLTRQKQIA